MSSFLLRCSELSAPCISGCKPRHRRLILRGPMALKEAFAPEAVAPDFPLRAGGLLGLPRKPSMPHLLTSSRSTTCCGVERNGHCCGFRRSSGCNCTITICRQLAWPRWRQPVSRWSVVGLRSIRRCVPSRTKVDPTEHRLCVDGRWIRRIAESTTRRCIARCYPIETNSGRARCRYGCSRRADY